MLSGGLTGDEIAALWLGSFTAVTGGRIGARWAARRIGPAERCLVIGSRAQAERIRDRIATSDARAIVVACAPPTGEDLAEADHDILRELVGELLVDRIIIAPADSDSRGVVALIRVAKALGVRVSVQPPGLEVVGTGFEFDEVNGLTMLGVRRFGLSRSSLCLKRAFDLVATSLGLLVAGPIIAMIALAIRIDSKGPIFFRQVRVGRDGRHFRILKFRSMVADAEEGKQDLRSLVDSGDGLFKLPNDPRITRVGGFLRRASLDELPQIWNVLRAEMSLVGPRPLVVEEDARVQGLDRSRLCLTPGMTGPWQVLGARVPLQEMVGIDYLYVTNWSLWLDLKVLIRTLRHVARRRNL
jgi:exopolysaccharide biosynthesis polyprenyl glycosylphosphotransferase